jgi:hypothetical protein
VRGAYEIPPFLPLGKGGILLFEKEGIGEISGGNVLSIMDSLSKIADLFIRIKRRKR